MTSPSRFSLVVRFAGAALHGDPARQRRAAEDLLNREGAEVVREVLRQVHLFAGFPAMVHTLNIIGPLLPAPAAEPEQEAAAEPGEAFFRSLYQEDADAVLGHLRRLDPVLTRWILSHAYGRVMQREVLPLPERERLAVLLLASAGCWKQWESHARICRRLGVPSRTLLEDALHCDWLDRETQAMVERGVAEALV